MSAEEREDEMEFGFSADGGKAVENSVVNPHLRHLVPMARLCEANEVARFLAERVKELERLNFHKDIRKVIEDAPNFNFDPTVMLRALRQVIG